MKTSIKFLSLVFGLLLATVSVEAQVFEIMPPGISNIPLGHQNGSHFGFTFKIKNISGQPFTGSILTRASVNGVIIDGLDSVYTSVAANGNGNTIDITVDSFPVNTPPFVLGANGVVVWVVDDNFNPLSEPDSATTLVTDQPSFMLTPTGLVDFPLAVNTNTPYDFRFKVLNVFEEDYTDELYFNMEAAGQVFRVPTPMSYKIKGQKAREIEINAFEYFSPPFELGYNPVRIWVDGNGAIALDTLDLELDVRERTTVGRPQPGNPGVLGLRNPTDGPVVIRTRPGIVVKGFQLYDLTGRMVFQHQDLSKVDLSGTNLEDGMYWMAADLSDGSRFLSKLLFVR